ncbi:LOW QUALITY PROTEIN: hypothetical protein PHMEG_0007113 [Phytophthora megakarya]|uniref:Uncharacterized protein n=1 Tax=Phytophthora megakarya TaxID=4795 RepID=A0A225WP55_9STRA|nr:LOW QUALITY PROTEIN: hypothetical protein PHMEG_0007113 [Phytophthora megakarya]
MNHVWNSSNVPYFWAGAHELRAMVQYMREPIVHDVNRHEDAHIQRYIYKTHRTTESSDHESGYGEALNDRDNTYVLAGLFIVCQRYLSYAIKNTISQGCSMDSYFSAGMQREIL